MWVRAAGLCSVLPPPSVIETLENLLTSIKGQEARGGVAQLTLQHSISLVEKLLM